MVIITLSKHGKDKLTGLSVLPRGPSGEKFTSLLDLAPYAGREGLFRGSF